MNLTDWLVHGDNAFASLDLTALFLALCLSFLGGHVLAWIYQYTHGGLSVSRPFIHTLVVMPVLVALVMMALHDNLVTAFGMMSVFAIVRFRNVLIDPHDTTYILAAIMLGMSAGTQRFSIAIIGCLVIAAVLLYLSFSGFGDRLKHGMLLNLRWTRSPAELSEVNTLLKRYGYNVECTSHRANPSGSDLSYRLLLRDVEQFEQLVAELRTMEGVSHLTSLRAEEPPTS
jgi:hypothetical protein